MRTSRVVAMLSLAGLAQPAWPAGFALIENSVSGLGNAFAGGSAAAEDASTIWFNPAGMTRLDGTLVEIGAHVIMPRAELDDAGVVTTADPRLAAAGLNTGSPIAGGDGGDGGVTRAVPNLYLSTALGERWRAGLGVTVPFGLATEYDEGWVGRYHAVDTELRTINVNPAVAYQVNERWSVGGGVSAVYADLKDYSNAIDSSFVCAGIVQATGGSFATTCPGIGGLGNASTDSHISLEGDDWGYGFNVGVLFQPDDRTRLGMHYRSRVELTFEGDADYTVDPRLEPAAAAAGRLRDAGFEADLTLPDSFSISSWQRISDRWAMMGDITWTNWSVFDELVAEFDDGAPPLRVPENWEDSWRFSLGMTWTASPAWQLRFGAAYDEGAVDSPRDRSPRIPDQDRVWASAGLTWTPAQNLVVDAAYTHLFIDEGRTAHPDPISGHLLQGDFDTAVDILSTQVRWSF